MNFTPIKTPIVAKRMFPNYVWDIPSTKKTIYLTFDDGPTPEITNWTLDVLKQHNAKATYFCIGKNVKKHPDIFQNILNDGHVIGNHTNNHVKGWRTSTKDYLTNIDKAQKIIDSEIINQKSLKANLFRPPYGQISPKQGKALMQLNYNIVMWNVLSFDWDNSISNQTCLENVIKNTSDGSIVVFHDSIKASNNMKYALPKTLEHFSKKGFSFKSIKL
jgi:peptidoglycan/xylan/chitin deacetylase (PgdA/CDA1 family)